jgi:hypothetical protein
MLFTPLFVTGTFPAIFGSRPFIAVFLFPEFEALALFLGHLFLFGAFVAGPG